MNKKITKNQLIRLAKMSRMIWSQLTLAEQEKWHCTLGSYEFIEQIICLLRLFDVKISDEEFEFVHNFTMGGDK